ncbi:MAG: AMP-binding protein [Pseudomonadota bacterium]
MAAEPAFDRTAYEDRLRAQGWWIDRTTDSLFTDVAARFPDREAIVAYRADRKDEPPVRITYAELATMAARAAAALRRLGVGPRDVVSLQLPNWWQFVVAVLACGRLGAVVNPLMPIFRERELAYMLRFCQAKVLVVPKRFRGFDHEAMALGLQDQLPDLQHVLVVDGHGTNDFEHCLLEARDTVAPPASAAQAPARADELAVLMFTSGTTGEPKGVMHSHNSLVACTRSMGARFGLTDQDVVMACSPVGHMNGYAATMLQGLMLGCTVVFQDIWEPRTGVEILAAERVTHTAAATPFLNDICDAVAAGAPRPVLKTFLCGGASIPPVTVERAIATLGLRISSLWGMTESLGGTLTEPSRAHEKSASTDGRPLEGVDIRIVDDKGQSVKTGEVGHLQVRSAQTFMGYYKRPDLRPFDAQGWFDSGDLARMDAQGYIRITGRTKDVLVRGGENVPVVEIENLLWKHPALSGAAIVGYPDRRLGERGCAFVTVRPGMHFDLAALQAYMAECKVAKQYWPERVEVIDAFPCTPSGKVQKFVLRERAKAFGDA